MPSRFRRWLAPPIFPDDATKTRHANLLNLGLILAMAHAVVMLIGIWLGGRTPPIVTAAVIALLVICGVLYHWLRKGRVQLVGLGLLVCGEIGITVIVAGLGTVQTPTAAYYLGVVIGAGLLFDLRGIVVATAVCSLTILGLIVAENAGWLPPRDHAVTVTHWIIYTALFGLMGMLTFVSLRLERQALRRADLEIAERRQVEAALVRERDLVRTLIDHLPDYIYVKDRASRFLLGNQAVVRHMGAGTAENLLGKTDRDFYPPALAASFYADEQAVLESGQAMVDRLEPNINASGILRWILTTKLPLRDSQGKIVGLVGIGHDITDRRQAEEALRWSEELYQSLVETLPLSVFRKDAAGRFTFANTLYARNEGRPLADILGKTDYELHPRELADKYRADDRRCIETGETLKTIEVHQPLGGAKAYVQVVKTPLYDATGQVSGIQGAFWDVTDRMRVEEALRDMNAALEERVAERTRALTEANIRLAELDQLKDEFIGRISHELRTPLTNIKLYLDLVERGKLEKRDDYLQTLHQQTDRLHQLIDNLLDVGQLKLRTLEVRHETFEINVLLHELVADRAAAARQRGLTLALSPRFDQPRVTTDRALLRQALIHLIANALAYTPREGVISISSALDTGSGPNPDQTWVTIEVRDTGPGISAKDLPHIFQPFYRGEAAADYRTPGAGVGLSIAQQIVGQLDGYISVDSQPEQGSTFTVWLKTTPDSP